ncbi:MAG: hypothetical protein KDC95_14785 [Planctomycetes bacterium]|nr:hypothetical protein [Planctomycetota bacterium]
MKTQACLPILLACTVGATFSAPSMAQNKRVIPDSAGREGSTATPTLFSQDAGRIQQVLDGNAVMNTVARLTSVNLRLDGTVMTAVASRTLSGFKLTLGTTSATPTTMSTTFATNRTGTQTLVFDGNLVLPAQTATSRPFNIKIPFNKVSIYAYDKTQGNLLVEMEAPGTAKADFGYMIDAHDQSTTRGFYTDYGTPGKLSTGEYARILVQDDFNLRPGRTFTMSVSALRQNYPTVAFLGFSGTTWGSLPLPLPLDGLGATGNVLEMSPDFALPVSLIQSGQTYVGSLRLTIPSTAFDLRLYSQWMFFDAAANNFGAAFSPGLAVWVQSTSQPTQYVTNKDPTAATGSLSNSGEGLVIELEGVIL